MTNNKRNFLLGKRGYTPTYKTGQLAMRRLDSQLPGVHNYLTEFTVENTELERIEFVAVLSNVQSKCWRSHPF